MSIYTQEWVSALHEELIYDHRESETVVFFLSVCAVETVPLQLGRRVLRLSNRTSMVLSALQIEYLK